MSADVAVPMPARSVRYCEICSFPYEYCEYGSPLSKGKANLELKDAELYARLYSDACLLYTSDAADE